MLTGGAEGSEDIWRSANMSAPFAIDAKWGEKLDEKRSMISGRELIVVIDDKGGIVD